MNDYILATTDQNYEIRIYPKLKSLYLRPTGNINHITGQEMIHMVFAILSSKHLQYLIIDQERVTGLSRSTKIWFLTELLGSKHFREAIMQLDQVIQIESSHTDTRKQLRVIPWAVTKVFGIQVTKSASLQAILETFAQEA